MMHLETSTCMAATLRQCISFQRELPRSLSRPTLYRQKSPALDLSIFMIYGAMANSVQEQEQMMETQTASAGEAGTKQPLMKKENNTMKVMVAIDESEGSFHALQWALDKLFRSIGVAPETNVEEVGMVVVAHVQQPFQQYVFPAGPGGAAFYATSTVVESVRKAQAENSAGLLSRALQLCKDKMIKAETLILEGDPKDMICQAAEQLHVDLLVMGSRGLGKLKRAFLGSVSDYCAHHAKCPILIVKPPKESTK